MVVVDVCAVLHRLPAAGSPMVQIQSIHLWLLWLRPSINLPESLRIACQRDLHLDLGRFALAMTLLCSAFQGSASSSNEARSRRVMEEESSTPPSLKLVSRSDERAWDARSDERAWDAGDPPRLLVAARPRVGILGSSADCN